jgi:hypothetical protein
MRGYERLVELAERERELIAAGRFDELAEIDAERDELVASLPEQAPPDARFLLERAARLQEESSRELAAALATVRVGLLELARGRRAAGGYAPAARGGQVLDAAG